ncbi:hypothetical protein A3C26_00515 [Candidatus Daviesbacteria bacterium RIFCSPHIGHO2_02_FULL_39_12]|uniref:Peptidase S74 domain-containing protein n=1 Tax=Candidatus Daviesbacteria bacterium RIFCSPHIGHO2_02_FULL_39_12 TaxID=1797770 RepID=A0A1F5J8Q8_9BACT|nr:MAG: hypothetical protein A3C26_00515 [Candidatus Daviesbacteria bacterium RIFCSPHIGHO2_02_FULL_39_12]
MSATKGIWVNNEINGGTSDSPAALYLNYSSTGNTVLNALGGNVGIGIAVPTNALDIWSSYNTYQTLYLRSDEATTGHARLYVATYGPGDAWSEYYTPASTWAAGADQSLDGYAINDNSILDANNIFFIKDGAPANSFYINSSGNIGIGTASPTDKLIVSGGNVGIGVSSPLTNLAVQGAGVLGWGVTGVAGPTNGLAVSGNVGVGTTTANSNLVVIGNATIGADYGQYSAPTNGLLIQGNVGIGTSVSSNPLTIGTDGTNGNGAYLTVGGVWTDGSSVTFKENFTKLSSQEILSKINQLNLTSWNYINEGPNVKHIGPVAEQFYSVFGLGNDNKHIAALDTSGVALAGIQGLSQDISKLKSQMSNLELNISNLNVGIGSSGNSISYIVSGILGEATESAKEASTSSSLDTKYQSQNTNSLEAKIASLSARVAELESKLASPSSVILAKEVRPESTSSATDSGVVASAPPQNDITGLNLTPPEILLATGSAELRNTFQDNTFKVGLDSLKVSGLKVSEATVSGMLKAYQAEISDNFKVFGQTTLASTTIAGDLVVDGTFSVTNGNEINVIGAACQDTSKEPKLTFEVGESCPGNGILYLQKSPLAQGLDIFNGKVKIDNQGNIVTQGEVNAQSLTITNNDPTKPTIGSGKILAGKTEVVILTESMTQNSKVFITPTSKTGKQSLIVIEKKAGESFTVSIEESYSKDITFDWWVVGSNDNSIEYKVSSIEAEVSSPVPRVLANDVAATFPAVPTWQDSGSGVAAVTDPDIDFVNGREGPDTTFPLITAIYPGTGFNILGEENGWIKIEYQPDVYGWILGSNE